MDRRNLNWAQAQWLLSKGVPPSAMFRPTPIMTCRGRVAVDGRFDEDPEGRRWLIFEENHDWAFWQPITGEIATETGRSFAFGEDLIHNPATTAFDQYLNIYANPHEWLQNERRGIVVFRWQFAFDRLRDVPRIAVSETLLSNYRRHMRPLHMPKLAVVPRPKRQTP